MTLQLVEGQDFSANYTLLQCIVRRDEYETWLALDTSSSERVQLEVFTTPLAADVRALVEQGIQSSRGLIHPNIARNYALEHSDGVDFIVSQYVRSTQAFVPDASGFARQWELLKQLFDVIGFAHSLGQAHGHLHPGNLEINESGMLVVSGFGMPAQFQHDNEFAAWTSPQVRRGDVPDPSDDVWSLGQLLHRGLTGSDFRGQAGFESNSPVPDDLRHLVSRMLSESPWERPSDIGQVRDLVKTYLLGDTEAPLQSLGGFSRPRSEPTSTTTATTTVHRLPRERHVMSAPIAFAIFALLLAIAGIVFFILPGEAPSPRNKAPAVASTAQPAQSPSSSRPEPSRQTPLEIAKQKEMEKQGSDIADELLRRQVELEDIGVQIWAPNDYKKVLDLSAHGDGAYREGQFENALDLYRQGIAVLKDLAANVDDIKQKNLDIGKSALEKGDFHTAIKAYTIVNAMSPKDKDIKHQLSRAENLEEVLALVKEGEFFESEERLTDARQKFNDAKKLDPEWAAAGTAVTRIDSKIAKKKFDDAMSIAFTALGNRQYDKARDAFKQAQAILPGSTEPGDGLQQIAIAKRQAKIDGLRDTVNSEIANEDWQAAINTYQQILDMDSTLVFARKGLDRVNHRLDLEKQLNRYLSQPTLMASNEELGDARQLLVSASKIDDAGPKLRKQLSDLSELIALARIPITVQLQSDKQTDVTVYKVGHLGKLDQTSVQLVPGRYTIVGQRPGYRDVQQVLTVLGGTRPKPVFISCTDKI